MTSAPVRLAPGFSGAAPADATRSVPRSHRATTSLVDGQVRLLGALLVADLIGQRLALPAPGGQVPLILPLSIVAVVLGLRRGLLRIDHGALSLAGLAMFTLACCTGAGSLATPGVSLPSLVYLLLTYVPLVTVVSGPGAAEVVRRLAELLVKVCTVLAVLSIAQLLVQFVGWHAPDPVGAIVPQQLLLSGYNTSSPVGYGASLYRCNGLVFLEPSFCSQFLGLAVVANAWLRQKNNRRFLLLLLGMATSVAGTGFVLLAAGLGTLVLIGRRDILLRLAPAVVIGGVAVALTPLGGLLVGRATEGASKDTSTGERFVIPVQVLGRGWLHEPLTALIGHGPGQANRFIVRALGADSGVVPLAPLKLVYEYGAIGAVPFAVFLLWTVTRGVVSPPLAAALATAYLLLSGSLQQPATVLPLWLLVAVARRVGSRRDSAEQPEQTVPG